MNKLLLAAVILLTLSSGSRADEAATPANDAFSQAMAEKMTKPMDAQTQKMVDGATADSKALVNKLMDQAAAQKDSPACKAMAAKLASASGRDFEIAAKYLDDNCN